MQFLLFRCADKIFGIDVQSVATVLPPARLIEIPSQSKYLHGILETRDHFIPVFSLHVLFELETGPLSENQRYVVFEYQPYYAVIVDEIIDVIELDPDIFMTEFQEKKKYIRALATTDKYPVYIIDQEKLHRFFKKRIKMVQPV